MDGELNLDLNLNLRRGVLFRLVAPNESKRFSSQMSAEIVRE